MRRLILLAAPMAAFAGLASGNTVHASGTTLYVDSGYHSMGI